jgi:O-antigen/teichoic acid export membrane protein
VLFQRLMKSSTPAARRPAPVGWPPVLACGVSSARTARKQVCSSAIRLLQKLAPVLKTLLSLQGLKTLFVQSSADLGHERYRRAGMTASTSYLAKGLTVFMSFISVPLTVHYLGAERYGVWLTISSLLLWVALTDFGLAGNALVCVLSETVGKDDRVSARHYTASAFWALVTIALIIGGVFIAIFHFIPWRAVFRVSDATSTQELDWTCGLVLTLFVINLPLSLVRSIYNAHQDGYLTNTWGIASSAISLLGLIVVTRSHGGLPQLVIALSGMPALALLASAYHAFVWRYPWLAPAPSAVKWTYTRRLLKMGGKYMIMQLAALGIYQSQAMIITQMLGPSKVMIFVVAFKIMTLPLELIHMGTVPFFSAFGEAKARNDWNWIKRAFKNITIASIVSGVSLAVALALFAKPLILVWTGSSAVPDTYLVIWLFFYTITGVSLVTSQQLLCGIERVETVLLSIIFCAIGCVVLGILFVHWWGLSGIAFAMAASMLITMGPIQFYEVRRVFRTV